MIERFIKLGDPCNLERIKMEREFNELIKFAEIGEIIVEFINNHDYVMGINRWIDEETDEDCTESHSFDSIEELLNYKKKD